MEAGDHDWIFDYVMQFLNSGRFDAAIMDFVDEKCAVFDNEDENKLKYSEIHEEFKEHVDAIISSNLEELGITEDIFYDACLQGRNSRYINKTVFDKIIALDDFLTFKKIMVKRNAELELETIRAFRNIAPGDMNVFGEDDEEEFEAALRLSSETAKEPLPDPDDIDFSKDERFQAVADVTTEEEMQEILQKSLLDIELLQRQEEMEQLELEQAIAISLALEDERLRQLALQAEFDMEADKLDDEEEYEEEERSQAKATVIATSVDTPEKGVKEDKVSAKQQPTFQREEDVKGSSVEDSPSFARADDKSEEVRRRKKKDKKAGAPAKALLDVPEPKPLKLKEFRPLPGILAGSANSELVKQAEELEERRRQSVDIFSRNQEMLAQQRAQTEKLREQVGADMDEVVAARRAKYMREQRDKLIAIKKAEREAKVKEEEERRAKAVESGEAGPPPGKIDIRDILQAQAQVKDDGKSAEEIVTERKRNAMRMALARRMKQELIENSEAQQAKAQEDQFSDLDRQLRQVEVLRRENQQREALLAEQVRRQHEAMAKNVQRSAASMKQG